MKIQVDYWQGCYPSSWKGAIVDDAFRHPAKFSSKLIRRIYEHLVAEGWVKAGDTVVDPFGGVALGGLDAIRLGLHWRGCELESHFVELGNRNIEFWADQFGWLPGDAQLLQGDSRFLAQVLAGASTTSTPEAGVSSPPYNLPMSDDGFDAAVGSPPYGDRSAAPTDVQGSDAGKLKMNEGDTYNVAVSSPPYANSINHDNGGIDPDKSDHQDYGPHSQMANSNTRYGSNPGQLGAMKAAGFEASVSSPPFLQSKGGTPEPKEGGAIDKSLYARHAAGNAAANGYGDSDGQMSSMDDKGFDAAVSSPPFRDSMSRDFVDSKERIDFARAHGISNAEKVSPIDVGRLNAPDRIYGSTSGQMGNDSGDDFWLAARAIVEQVYAVLAPGGHAVWVVKDYVRNKERVPFCDQWRQVCEAVGFVTLHEHRAMLVHHNGRQRTLDGGEVEFVTSSKSFFRRLAESKGSPSIDWEVVYCMVKPGDFKTLDLCG